MRDVNGDGKLDVVAHSLTSLEAYVFKGSGSGTLGPAQTQALEDVPGVMALGDFNGDSKPELAGVLYSARSKLLLAANDGAGNFSALPSLQLRHLGTSLFAVDVDGDGRADLISADTFDSGIFLSEGDGTFSFVDGFGFEPVVVLDANGDGRPDLFGGSLSLFLNTAKN